MKPIANAALGRLKKLEIDVPIGVGVFLNNIPFKSRPFIGASYRDAQKKINSYEKYDDKAKSNFILMHMQSIVSYAYNNVPFYNQFYKSHGYSPSSLKDFSSISEIPLVTKEILRAVPLEERSVMVPGRFKANTGGSTGEPFHFYTDPSRIGSEWAHIHRVWAKLGYRQGDLKLTFGGRLVSSKHVKYDFKRNSLNYNIYSDFNLNNIELLKIVKKNEIRYIHGYPSAIYRFAQSVRNNEELKANINASLKGIFLVSEYADPRQRSLTEEILGCPSISFYGHTEACAFAAETQPYVYKPYQTYGYSEALPNDLGSYDLIATSYYNMASPLIRYNTRDSISDLVVESNILSKFKILRGRQSEYVRDADNNKIELTALLFGRHHEIFDFISSIQVYQQNPGKIELFIVPNSSISSVQNWVSLIDVSGVKLDVKITLREQPILSKAGKVGLIVKNVP